MQISGSELNLRPVHNFGHLRILSAIDVGLEMQRRESAEAGQDLSPDARMLSERVQNYLEQLRNNEFEGTTDFPIPQEEAKLTLSAIKRATSNPEAAREISEIALPQIVQIRNEQAASSDVMAWLQTRAAA